MLRLFDALRTDAKASRERRELVSLWERLVRFSGQAQAKRESLVSRVLDRFSFPDAAIREAAAALLHNLLLFKGYFVTPGVNLNRPMAISEVWVARTLVLRQLKVFEDPQTQQQIGDAFASILGNILHGMPGLPARAGETPFLAVPLSALLPDPALSVEAMFGIVLGNPENEQLFPRLYAALERNILSVSGINPDRRVSKEPLRPTQAKDKGSAELVEEYLAGTPLVELFQTPLPFAIPLSARFEHMHVLGGSGHGKTQLLQSLILRDLEALAAGKGSLVVIDSQGDLIRTILGLAELSPTREGSLADRLVLIDPNDIEHPPCLNLFDFGLKRLERYGAVEREKLVNGAIALYEYLFGALLGAELTQRQGVIFRYLARLLMVVPGATIHTLREFMEEPEATRAHLGKLDPTSRHFFETQFYSKVFDDTRQQILTRLWGVLSNSVLARMFSHQENRLDVFTALNRGSLILINTAKDLLKQEGCEILGRFFIALIAQATQERAGLSPERRRATFVYVDEAQDYFDAGLEQLLNQARKYKVGLILAHQNLGQLEPRLQAAVMASTAIKLAGGISAKDAAVMAREMGCAPEYLQNMRKYARYTEFACFIRNVTPRPLRLAVPFGRMEGKPRVSEAALGTLLARNRSRFCATRDDHLVPSSRARTQQLASGFALGKQEIL